MQLKKIAYHVSSPQNRNSIKEKGLIPSVGECYASFYSDKKLLGKAVFVSLDKENLFDSLFDDDIWKIELDESIKWHKDPYMDFPFAYTYQTINKNNLTLFYKGTGNDNL